MGGAGAAPTAAGTGRSKASGDTVAAISDWLWSAHAAVRGRLCGRAVDCLGCVDVGERCFVGGWAVMRLNREIMAVYFGVPTVWLVGLCLLIWGVAG